MFKTKDELKRRKQLINLHNHLVNRGYTLGMVLEEVKSLYGIRSNVELAEMLEVTTGLVSHFKTGRRADIKASTYLYYLEQLDKALSLDIAELKEYLE